MPIFEVEFGPKGETPIERKTVQAADLREAIQNVMNEFKGDARIGDASTWHVTARSISNANRT